MRCCERKAEHILFEVGQESEKASPTSDTWAKIWRVNSQAKREERQSRQMEQYVQRSLEGKEFETHSQRK